MKWVLLIAALLGARGIAFNGGGEVVTIVNGIYNTDSFCINTGYIPSSWQLTYEATYAITGADQNSVLFGAGYSGLSGYSENYSHISICAVYLDRLVSVSFYGTHSWDNRSKSQRLALISTVSDPVFHTVSFHKTSLSSNTDITLDNSRLSVSSWSSSSHDAITLPIGILGRMDNDNVMGNIARNFIFKELKILDGQTVVKDYKSAVRGSDIGVYESVDGVFIAGQGSGGHTL